MTIDEYTARLAELTEEELGKFNIDLGGGGDRTREQRVREYVQDSKYERRICQLLGLKTEDEKRTDASVKSAAAAAQSATAAAQSAKLAQSSLRVSVVVCVAAVIAAIAAIIAIFVG